jgi:hypothetical protein
MQTFKPRGRMKGGDSADNIHPTVKGCHPDTQESSVLQKHKEVLDELLRRTKLAFPGRKCNWQNINLGKDPQ